MSPHDDSRASHLRNEALAIWQAGVDAVAPRRLINESVRVGQNSLHLGAAQFDLDTIRQIAVVGGGKAGAEMALALEQALGKRVLQDKNVSGWINVPAGTLRPTERIKLYAARPAGVNEPTAEAARGAAEILKIVAALGPSDLCIALISGGGSALLPVPAEGVSLVDKVAVTRALSAAGANVEELNLVRSALSRIKGGGLARACMAGQLVSLIISDVLGDPLRTIASGPTVAVNAAPQEALQIMERFDLLGDDSLRQVVHWLRNCKPQARVPNTCAVTNIVIGNNATAVDAAGIKAEQLGYQHAMTSANKSEGLAEDVGRHLAQMALHMRTAPVPNCLISGGEPVVRLITEAQRGLGGRNQQLILAAAYEVWSDFPRDIVMLSAGTDGEDGPTDAAGAMVDSELAALARAKQLDPQRFLAANDAYHFFDAIGGLIKTGPTGTNVCDLRVVLVDRHNR